MGRPLKGLTPKNKPAQVRTEIDMFNLAVEKFGSFQRFVDHYIYKLDPSRRPKKGKNGKHIKLTL